MRLEIQMYVYTNKLPSNELQLYRCLSCTRPLFKTNSKRIVLSNAYGATLKDLPPSSTVIEHQCHSCKSSYTILFQ
jgi:hypothetical protein